MEGFLHRVKKIGGGAISDKFRIRFVTRRLTAAVSGRGSCGDVNFDVYLKLDSLKRFGGVWYPL